MTYKVFLDSDILLDILLMREPHFEDSVALLYLRMEHQLELFTTSSIILNTNYIATKVHNSIKAKAGVAELLKFVEILEPSKAQLLSCFSNNYPDVEDAVQYFTALHHTSLHYYISRNIKHYKFKKAELPVLTPTAFLKLLK